MNMRIQQVQHGLRKQSSDRCPRFVRKKADRDTDFLKEDGICMLNSYWFHLPPEEAKKQRAEMAKLMPIGRIGEPEENRPGAAGW